MERLFDLWDDLSFSYPNFNRWKWRTVQIAMATEALFLALASNLTENPSLSYMAIGLLAVVVIAEKVRAERRGRGPTGFQYLWALTLGKHLMGYGDVGFFPWLGAVNQAAKHYFPPRNSQVEEAESGVCTFDQYLRYHANKRGLGAGNDETELRRASKKSSY